MFTKPGSAWASMTETVKLTSGFGGSFGVSVSVSGDTVAVGATNTLGYGSAFVYAKPTSGWADVASEIPAMLVASDGGQYGYFGRSVSISGNTVVVGAPQWGDMASTAARERPMCSLSRSPVGIASVWAP